MGRNFNGSLKYRNKIVEIDGIKFRSKKESKRYGELKLLMRVGEIFCLEMQPRFPLYIESNGEKIFLCTYVGDFKYKTKGGQEVVEDVKGMRTELFKLKEKLYNAQYTTKLSII